MSIKADTIPSYRPFSVDDVVLYSSDKGPWQTKSGGLMHVIMAYDNEILKLLNETKEEELKIAPEVKLGFRTFHTKGIARDTIGGVHFHRIKREFICLSSGKVEFILEDVYGGIKNMILDQSNRSLYIPPFVFHTYKVIEPAELIGISNTLYDHEKPETHDTYDRATFDILQDYYKSKL